MANQRLIRYLKQGGVIAYPTESCYGLGCDPKNKRAVEKILLLKNDLIFLLFDIQQKSLFVTNL